MIKKKSYLLLFFFIGIIFILIGCRFFTKRGVVDYFTRVMRGDYQTNVTLTKEENDQAGNYTVYIDGNYYYYDSIKKAICDLSKNVVINLEDEILKIASNEKYIYCQTYDNLLQYKIDGTLVAKNDIEYGDMYVGKYNVYFRGYETGVCYIYSAENIEKASDNIKECEKLFPTQAGVIKIGIETADAYIGWFDTDELTEPVILNCPEYSRIDKTTFVIDKETGKTKLGAGFDCIGMEKDIFYHGDYYGTYNGNDTIFAITHTGKTTNIKGIDNGDANIKYVRSAKDGMNLITLSEQYLVGGFSSYDFYTSGSIGEYSKGRICYIDLEKEKVVKEYILEDEIVLFMNEDQFVTLKNNEVLFYGASTGKIVRTEVLRDYQPRKDYQVEVCGKKIFFFCEGILLDWCEL